MTSTTQQTPHERGASKANEATVSDVLLAWDKVFQGLKAYLRTNATVVAADFQLSIKAILVTLICLLVLIALGIVVWVSLMVGMTYGLTSFGYHWLWSLLLVLVINLGAWLFTKRILSSAISSIKMTATADLLFTSQSE
ncbi:hypothetical protein [uncultured Paraglaciecola sp.]|uniref:hypothetical protein n=1 Tax=uncultured Paraglaciecola sp. TaxID=1765024 RepID=UPI0030DB2A73|tara:strand:- start:36997 stop:37413 length:417 start_codon:yes stop_codon:yes gene_type:complete